jgi:hypothetical protein
LNTQGLGEGEGQVFETSTGPLLAPPVLSFVMPGLAGSSVSSESRTTTARSSRLEHDLGNSIEIPSSALRVDLVPSIDPLALDPLAVGSTVAQAEIFQSHWQDSVDDFFSSEFEELPAQPRG